MNFEFDPTNSNQSNTIKPTSRARFRRGPSHSQQESSDMHMPCSLDTHKTKKIKLASSGSKTIHSVVTGEVSVYNRRPGSTITLEENNSSKYHFLNSSSAIGTSTIEEESIQYGNRVTNLIDFSKRPSSSTDAGTRASAIDEETVYTQKGDCFFSFLKPSTTTAVLGADEETVYNGKRGGIFLFLQNQQSNREEENFNSRQKTTGKTIQFNTIQQSGKTTQECSVSNAEACDQTLIGANPSSTSGAGQKRRKEMSNTVRVSTDSSGQSEMPPDDYKWWKCGSKKIKGSPYPRSYYKCIKWKEDNCKAKKQVMRVPDQLSMLDITYKRNHTHSPPETPINLLINVTNTEHVVSHAYTSTTSNIDVNLPVPFEEELTNCHTPQFFKFL